MSIEGVPVAHFRNGLIEVYTRMRGPLTEADIAIGETAGRWHLDPVADALVAVAEAADAMRKQEDGIWDDTLLQAALRNLDAALAEAQTGAA